MAVAEDAQNLEIEGVIGFSGNVPNGLNYTPCGNYVLFALGSIVVVKNTQTNDKAFLEGHSSDISTMAVSHDGTRLATGQRNKNVTRADVLVWDLEVAKKNCDDHHGTNSGGALVHRLHQHLGAVQDLDFSCDDKYLCTLGGVDDNALVIWEVETGTAICGSPAFDDSGLSVRWLNNRNDRLVSGGNYHLRVWQVDVSAPKLHAKTAKMGTMRRVIQCITIDHDDEYAYCGSKTGELLRFKIDRDPIQSFNDPDRIIPTLKAYSKERFGMGIKSCKCIVNRATGEENIIVGAGDGTVALLNQDLRVIRDCRAQLMGSVTSISMSGNGEGFLAGTTQSNRYYVTMNWDVELRATGHSSPVNDVCFPSGCSDLFITCSSSDIRIWNAQLRQELLRIQVPNLVCNCIGITPNGGTIVSGWTDGKIRAFYPESGRLKFVITDAHAESVTSLAVCNDDEGRPPWRIVSGGDDGRVRVWNITSSHQALKHSMKEHRAAVLCIRVARDNSQCVSASADGSCIVWDLQRSVRILAFFEPTVFQAVLYHPDESQILTCGSNHKISYWDAYDGQAIRVIDGSEDEMTSLDVDSEGVSFVSGDAGKLVKMWHYDDGISTAIGTGHSGRVASVKFSPDMKQIVSVGSEGAIFIWNMPEQH
mmetsp:Transcript_14946/g.44290  ORF Transcript_14946/g.44290 Transcript_14946/m.44290 type:complete len:648 (-) Transcript_14946:150-2093(-)